MSGRGSDHAAHDGAGRHGAVGDRAVRDGGIGAIDAIGVLAQRDVEVRPGLWHLEAYTFEGLLTVVRPEPVDAAGAALVACGGAMGGLLGPGDALYQRLGDAWVGVGV